MKKLFLQFILISLLLSSCSKKKPIITSSYKAPNIDQAVLYVGIDYSKDKAIRIQNSGNEPISITSEYHFEWKDISNTQTSVWNEVIRAGCGNHGHYIIEPDEVLHLNNFSIQRYLGDINSEKFAYRIGVFTAGYNSEGNAKMKIFWSNEFQHHSD